ncbi:MAG: PrsW family glutamic-type intramembrane protease, partial [Candidatus Limnocylindrales bacterium]
MSGPQPQSQGPATLPPAASAAVGAPAFATASGPQVAAGEPYLPRWGVQTGFFQRRQPAFWLFVILLVLTTLTVIGEQVLYLQYFPEGWIISVVLLALYVVPVVLAIYVLDLFEREPLSLIIAAFLWGGVIAIGLAVVINTSLLEVLAKLFGASFAQTWGVALIAPPVEETLKFLGVVTIFLIARSEIDDLFDGFVYGAIVGLGFAAAENVQYFIQAIGRPGAGDQIGPVLQMFTFRAILIGAYMHVLWTGLSGLGLAYYVTQRDQRRQKRLLYAVGLFVLAIVAHFIWNSPWLTELLTGFGGVFVFGLVKGLPFLIFLVLLVLLAQRREQRWFGAFTARDLGTDVLSQAEMAELGGLRSRWRARRAMGARKGPQAGKLHGQLQREQINLAMIRSRAGSDDDPNVVAQRDRIRGIRAQIQELPDVPQLVAMPYVAPAAPGATAAPAPAVAPVAPAVAPVAPAVSPPEPPPAPAAPVWAPTHMVPATGMAAWAAPDPSQPPV